jgi:hypothetical protein
MNTYLLLLFNKTNTKGYIVNDFLTEWFILIVFFYISVQNRLMFLLDFQNIVNNTSYAEGHRIGAAKPLLENSSQIKVDYTLL